MHTKIVTKGYSFVLHVYHEHRNLQSSSVHHHHHHASLSVALILRNSRTTRLPIPPRSTCRAARIPISHLHITSAHICSYSIFTYLSARPLYPGNTYFSEELSWQQLTPPSACHHRPGRRRCFVTCANTAIRYVDPLVHVLGISARLCSSFRLHPFLLFGRS